MSATQAVLLVLVLVAFVIGWVARGRRETADPVRARGETGAGEVDAAFAASLTSFQAALTLWQIEGGATSAHARRAIATRTARPPAPPTTALTQRPSCTPTAPPDLTYTHLTQDPGSNHLFQAVTSA